MFNSSVQTSPSSPGSDRSVLQKRILAVCVAIGLLLIVASLFRGGPSGGGSTQKQTDSRVTSLKEPLPSTQEKVSIKKQNFSTAKKDSDKVPVGFPDDLPVETKGAMEGYTVSYPDKQATQYAFLYSTEKTVAEKYQEYLSYMTKKGYSFGPNGKNETLGSLYGSLGGDKLQVYIRTENGKTVVSLSFVDNS